MSIENYKERDALLAKEAKIKAVARVVCYNEIGEPVEIVYDPLNNVYDWHVGGERVKGASQRAVALFLPQLSN